MILKPISYQWLIWGVSRLLPGDLPPKVRARIEADRRRAGALRVITRRITIPWVEDRSLSARFIGDLKRLRGALPRSDSTSVMSTSRQSAAAVTARGSDLRTFGFTSMEGSSAVPETPAAHWASAAASGRRWRC